MRLLMKRRSVERIADTKESYEKLINLGYTVKKDLEKENAAGTTEDKATEQEVEKTEEAGTGAKESENQDTASDDNATVIPEEAEAAEPEVPNKPETKKQKKPTSGKRAAEQEVK